MLARSVLSASHQARVTQCDEIPGGAAPGDPYVDEIELDDAVAGLIDVDGVPHLILGPGDEHSPGPALLMFTGVADRLGTLRLAGTLLAPIAPGADARVAEVLQEHLSCMTEPYRAHYLDTYGPPRLTAMPFRPSAIWVAGPAPEGGSGDPPPLVAVDLAAYLAAHPDPWAVHGADARQHLEEHHQSDLLRLVHQAGAAPSATVSVVHLDADAVSLTAIGPEGVTDVIVPFTPPAATPHEAEHRLFHHA